VFKDQVIYFVVQPGLELKASQAKRKTEYLDSKKGECREGVFVEKQLSNKALRHQSTQ